MPFVCSRTLLKTDLKTLRVRIISVLSSIAARGWLEQ